MIEMHINNPVLLVLVDHLLKTKKELKKIEETVHTKYIYENELGKACFRHDMAYGNFKDLSRRTASDKVLRDKAFNIAKNRKYDEYQRSFASMLYKFFDKETSESDDNNETKRNLQFWIGWGITKTNY